MPLELPPVQRFVASSGVRIYRLPCEAFRNFIAYAYVVLGAGPPTLIDTGSGYDCSNDHLAAGIEEVHTRFGEPLRLSDIHRVILTHGHIDHFGGLPFVLEHARAEVGIHRLDRRVLTAYEERVIVATKALRVYLERAGVEAEVQPALMQMYGFSKKHVRSVPVNFIIEDGQELDGLRFIHTPGHCPGQVCIAIGDILISADHILERTTPHQSPESITAYTGLGHYLEALQKVSQLGGFDLALGGHENPIRDVYKRITAIQDSHVRKLDKVLELLRTRGAPATIREIQQGMYPNANGFNVLLALEEVGAHVEFLYQQGDLAVVNLDQVEADDNPALSYQVA